MLSGAVPARFAERAMDAVRAYLIARQSRIILLLTPAFDHSASQDPGYIKGYPPGIRENGGQYTHAAVWVVMAIAKLGSGDEATELFHMINPVNHTRTPADVARYRIEPYVMAGDVYSRDAHAGRGGWSWYTGSAGWMYRAGLESILGLRRRGDTFVIDPCVPSSWSEYSISWQHHSTCYEIAVTNPDHVWKGVMSAELDGAPVDHMAIPIVDDGKTHQRQDRAGPQVISGSSRVVRKFIHEAQNHRITEVFFEMHFENRFRAFSVSEFLCDAFRLEAATCSRRARARTHRARGTW